MKISTPVRTPAFLTALLSALLVAPSAYADYQLIPAATAYAENYYDAQRAPQNVINGSGLSSEGLHGTAQSTIWMGATTKASWLLIDFGCVTRIDRLKIWNYNQAGYSNRGVRQVDFYASVSDTLDPTVSPDFSDSATWSLVAEDLEIEQATGAANDPGMDPILLDAPCYTRWFAIQIDSDWGGGYRGLSEIQFFMQVENCTASVDAFTSVSDTDTTFHAILDLEGAPSCPVTVLYGVHDAGYNLDAWEHTLPLGDIASGPFTTSLTGLTPNASYVLRLAIHDTPSSVRLSQPAFFITGPVTLELSPDFLETDSKPKALIARRPSSAIDTDLTVAYLLSGDAAPLYAADLPGTLTIPAGESFARQPFTPVRNTESTDDQVLSVTLLQGGYQLGSPASTSVTILDSASAHATTVSWTGLAGTPHWSDPSNWSPSRTPLSIDTVLIQDACSETSPITLRSITTLNALTLAKNTGSLGALTLQDGASLYALANISLADASDSTAYLSLSNARLETAKNLTLAQSGCASLLATNSQISSGENFSSSTRAGSESSLTLLPGSSMTAYSTEIAQNGTSTITLSGATLSVSRKTFFARNEGSHATLLIDQGGSYIGGSQDANFGVDGSASIILRHGKITNSGFGTFLGANAHGSATLEIDEQGSFEYPATTLHVGVLGSATIHLRGGSISKGGSGTGSLVIRENEAGSGLIEGWGTITSSKNFTYVNNGILRADGQNQPRELFLNMSADTSISFNNTLENTSTNGWYAIQQGRIRTQHRVNIPVSESATYTWGEAADDPEIDLVHSARIYFHSLTTRITSITTELIATDAPTLPAPPVGSNPIALWRIQTDGTFQSFDFEAHLDPLVANGSDIRLARYDDASESWTWLPTQALDTARVLTPNLPPLGSQKIGLLLATASPQATLILLR